MTAHKPDAFLAAIDAIATADLSADTRRPSAKHAPQTWPCTQCAGSGTWQSRGFHGKSGPCYACKGVGHFTTAPAFRAKKKAAFQKGLETKAQNLAARIAAFNGENPGLHDYLASARSWSEFAGKLADEISERGSLTERQLAAAQSMRAKAAARREAKQAERTSEVDLAGIFTMFDKARENGLKKLIYRAKGLKISPAKEGSANAGGLYVKTNGGDYLGKVMGSKFIASAAATDEHKALLAEIAVDPSKVARDYGKETGQCCCCGRELSDPISIAQGIGPICANGWGL